MFSDFKYVNLEAPDVRGFAMSDPRGFLAANNSKVIFDEMQRVPELFSYLQTIVDERGEMGQFIISSSQNFQLMQEITQSLAGRVAIFKLFPFEFMEMKNANWLSEELSETITKGFYPAVFERDLNHDKYYSNYIDTYIKRDISLLINIQDGKTFNNFIKLCALRAGSLLNLNDLARDAGISHTTARNWLSILEMSFILFTLPPYHTNFGKRIIKSPKLYFYDVGLLCHLLNIRKGKLSSLHSMWGNIFENMIVSELVKQNAHNGLLRDYYFWRDSKGHEVDLLYSENDQLTIYEVKSGQTIQDRMFSGLSYFDKISAGGVTSKHLVYGGATAQKRTHFQVIPWDKVN